MKNEKTSIVLILCMSVLTLAKALLPPKYFALSFIFLPFIIIGIGLIVYRKK